MIHKQILNLVSSQRIELPYEANILDVQLHNEQICIWYEFRPTEFPTSYRRVKMIDMDQEEEVDYERYNYLATVQANKFVWHLFISKLKDSPGRLDREL